MEHFLSVIAQSLRNVGFKTTVSYGTLYVNGTAFSAYPYNRPRRIEFCGEYFPIREQKFDVAAAVQAFLRHYPQVLLSQQRRQQRDAEERARRTAAEQARAEREALDKECREVVAKYNGEKRSVSANGPEVSPNVHFAYVGDGKYVVYAFFEDGGQALVACDALGEFTEKHL